MTPQEKKFIAMVAATCGGPRATVRNIIAAADYTKYTCDLSRTGADEVKARPLLAALGFTEKPRKGSSSGDFSSNVYGSDYSHPSGIVVSVTSTFHDRAQFNIFVSGWRDGVVLGY